MNTIKFAPYNEFITEQHNVETATVEDFVAFDYHGKFYNPCNLNIFITNKCQNNCDFCINKQNDRTDVDDKLYFTILYDGLETLVGGNLHLEATITGGEPTLNPKRFVETLKCLREYNIKERTVSTTGIGLLNKYEGKTILQHLIDFDYTHNISISRMAIDENENNQILNGNNIDNETLRKIAFNAYVNGVQLRTSTNIIPGHVDSVKKILDFVDFQHSLGINSCLFREIVGPGCFPIDDMCETIRTCQDFAYERTLNGMFYDIDVYLYRASTGQEYIVKLYKTHVVNKSVIGTLSFNQGKFRLGFNGEVIYGK